MTAAIFPIEIEEVLVAKIVLSETKLLINFALDLAKKCPKIAFRIKIHPQLYSKQNYFKYIINQKKMSNIQISNNSFLDDILWSSHAIYRGSTSILEAISLGVIPIYYHIKEELIIDPLFLIKNKKHYVNSIHDTIKLFSLWKQMTSKQKLNDKMRYINFTNSIVQPLNIRVLKKIM